MMPKGSRGASDASLFPAIAAGSTIAAAAQSTPIPTVLADCQSGQSTVTFANPAFVAMTGFAAESISGQPLLDLFRHSADPGKLALMENAMARNNAGIWQINCPTANGSAALAAAILTPIHDRAGTAMQYILNLFDLGSMLRVWDRQNTDPFLYDEAPGAIAITRGPQHQLIYVNASFRKFVGRSGLIGRTVAEALPDIAEHKMQALLDRVYAIGVPFRGADMPVTVNSPERGHSDARLIDIVFSPVRDDSGAITGLFCEGHDVTEEHNAHIELAAVRTQMIHVARVNAMGTMAATLAHELNQPLTAIGNYIAGAKQIEGKPVDVDRLLVALDGIEQAAQRAAGIVNHLRQMTKHRKPRREPFNLNVAVAECIRLVKPSCRPEITYRNEVPGHITMTADRVKIQQVLINLLQNACEAMEDTAMPQVSVSAWEQADTLVLSLIDTGDGVPPDTAETLFSWSNSSKAEGMGLGLSICRTIIELHHGRIWLERTGPGGSEFRFCLPLAA